MNADKICKVTDCKNSAIANSDFCSQHKLFINMKCSCGADLKVKARNYEQGKEYFCRSCSSRRRIEEYNKTDAAKKQRNENIKKYNSSDKAKINREKGLKYIHDNYTGSKKHIEQIRSLGLKYGPMPTNTKKRKIKKSVEEGYS